MSIYREVLRCVIKFRGTAVQAMVKLSWRSPIFQVLKAGEGVDGSGGVGHARVAADPVDALICPVAHAPKAGARHAGLAAQPLQPHPTRPSHLRRGGGGTLSGMRRRRQTRRLGAEQGQQARQADPTSPKLTRRLGFPKWTHTEAVALFSRCRLLYGVLARLLRYATRHLEPSYMRRAEWESFLTRRA